MAAKRKSLQNLWIGAGCLFFVGFTVKQVLWMKISGHAKQMRDEGNDKASVFLKNAERNAKKFTIPELTEAERELFRNKVRSGEIKDISKFTPQSNTPLETNSVGIATDKCH